MDTDHYGSAGQQFMVFSLYPDNLSGPVEGGLFSRFELLFLSGSNNLLPHRFFAAVDGRH
jgi:hypothetical protein